MTATGVPSIPRDCPLVVGIDLGGTGTRVVAMSTQGRVLARRTVKTPRRFKDSTSVEFLRSEILAAVAGGHIVGMAIGASGPIDRDGVIRNPDTLPAFSGTSIVEALADSLAVPVQIENDTVCAAIAEHALGAGRGCDSLLHVTLGTGIGVSYLHHGHPVRGGDGLHPEAGHLTVSLPTPACYCGRQRCWEQAASRQALERGAAMTLTSSQPARRPVEELAFRASQGDEACLTVFNDYAAALADGLGNLLAAHRPEVVVLGGSVAAYFDLFGRTVTKNLDRLGDWISHAALRPTQLDDHGGAIGAALIALRSQQAAPTG